jgi:glycosyltransferase involved in cell wall biosynthesis
MRIALLTDGIYPYVIGGMQKHSFYLASYFAKNEIFVDLYHTANNLNEAAQISCFPEEEKKYIRSVVIPFPAFKKIPGHYIRESYAYSKAIFKELVNSKKEYDFIYVQGLAGMYLLDNKKKLNCPVGVNFHGLEMFQKAPDLKSRIAQYFFKGPVKRSLQASDVVFSLGGKLTELLVTEGVPYGKVSQISIGIDPSWIREEPVQSAEIIRFVFVGRYERRKGTEELFEALKQLKDHDLKLAVIGAIPFGKRLEDNRITYFGNISEPEKIKDILKSSDVLVCPSHSEGMPTVILEGMAEGLAIIASNVGAVAEQVDDENGLLIKPGNVNELKSALLEFCKLPPEKLEMMKANSINRIKERFLWERVISLTINEIQRIRSTSDKA